MSQFHLNNNAVRNADGLWINSQVFREQGVHFMKNGYYCSDPLGSPSHREFWDQELDRCINGYSSGGAKITQHHYFYLNYTQIKLVEEDVNGGKVKVKEIKQPDFWDGDYNFFWAIEIARNGLFENASLVPSTKEDRDEYWKLEKERLSIVSNNKDGKSDLITGLLKENSDRRLALEEKALNTLHLYFTIEIDWRDGGHHIIIGKSRRKGYSYKNAAICANIYNTIRKSTCIVGAFDKKYLYPEGTMGMASTYLSFLNEHTAWAKGREYVDKQEHKRASFKETNAQGVTVESGYLSQIMGLTFADNPAAARGKDPYIVLYEESGMFPNLKESYRATSPSLEAGKYITGQQIIFGTGGDMEYGTVDYADIFYHPKQDNLMPFVNIWDDEAENSCCGFFHPVSWNMEGFYDKQGNSDIESATAHEKAIRIKIIADSTSSGAIQQRVQEHPFNPAEAFLTVSMNDFPVIELRNQLNRVKRDSLHLRFGQPCFLFPEDKLVRGEDGVEKLVRKIVAKPDLDNLIEPLWDYKPKNNNLKGGVVIYEHPVNNPPKGLYKIGFDPYRQEQSTMTVPSLASIYVYKCIRKGDFTRNIIVAQYVGRPYDPNDVNRIAEMLAELYNAEIMFENEVTHVKDYFIRRKKVHLMCLQPDAMIAKATQNSKVKRTWGCHMTDKIKDAGEKYIKQWLLEERDYDEDNRAILNLDTLNDPALLEELILYNRKGNFDRCLVAGTMITTINGIKDIKDIEIGDLVLTVDGTFREVTAKCKNNYKGEIYKLSIIGQADNIKTTNNHPLLIASTKMVKHNTKLKVLNNIKYKRADELTDKYQFAYIPKRINLDKNDFSDDILYLIGWVMGDGYVNSKSNNVSICLQYNQGIIADRLMKIIDNLTDDEELTIQKPFIRNNKTVNTRRKYKNTKTRKIIKWGYIQIVKTSKRLTELLLSVGCKPNNKKISNILYSTSNLMPLVIGLLEADGHQKFNNIGKYERCNIEMATIYKDLLLQVRQILLDNGIWSSLSNVVRGDNKEQLRLNISTNCINKLLSYYKSIKFVRHNIFCQKEIQIETEEGFWTPIKMINKKLQETEVYNIEVASSHTYIANGIVNHNCMAFMMIMLQLADEDEQKEYQDSNTASVENEILTLMKSQFKNRTGLAYPN